ncbi:MAG: hypothetical protein JWR89_4657 [Tardiphaga sp.]|nr:hypothetical protein [Tardiphaga sp.]
MMKLTGEKRFPLPRGVERNIGDAVKVGWLFYVSLQKGCYVGRSEFPDEETEFKYDVLAGSKLICSGAGYAALVIRSHQNHSETRAF